MVRSSCGGHTPLLAPPASAVPSAKPIERPRRPRAVQDAPFGSSAPRRAGATARSRASVGASTRAAAAAATWRQRGQRCAPRAQACHGSQARPSPPPRPPRSRAQRRRPRVPSCSGASGLATRVSTLTCGLQAATAAAEARARRAAGGWSLCSTPGNRRARPRTFAPCALASGLATRSRV
jgi:hypothetical protein